MRESGAQHPSHTLIAQADILRRFVDRISHKAGAALAQMETAGVTLAQVRLMHLIGRFAGVSISTLAESYPVSTAAVSQMVERLVRQQLLTRNEDAVDRRRKSISLAPAGREFLRGLEKARTADYAAGLSRLGSASRTRLAEYLAEALADLETDSSS